MDKHKQRGSSFLFANPHLRRGNVATLTISIAIILLTLATSSKAADHIPPSADEAEPADGVKVKTIEESASAPASEEETGDKPSKKMGKIKSSEPEEQTFEGIITTANEKPIEGAIVKIKELKIETQSDSEGAIQLRIPPCKYEIEAAAPGFAPYKETMNFDSGLALAGFTIYMTYDLGEVVVTGAATEKLISESPVRTQVIDRKDIEQKGAANLAQALKHTTGVRLENNCQNCNFTQLRLNGLDGRYSQILINGRPVFSALAGVYGLEQIPAEMIDRIEIVKGGGSALYGGNAVAGVVNVVTKRPDKDFGSLSVSGFTLGEQWGGHSLGGRAGIVNKAKTLALVVSGSLDSREAWDANDDGFSDIGMFRQHSFVGDLYWDPIPRGALTLRLQSLGERRRGGDNLDVPEFDAAVSEGAFTLRQGGEARWKHSFSSGISYEFGYAFAHTSRDSYYGGGGDVELPLNPSREDYEEFWEQKSAALGAYGTTRNPVHFGDAMLFLPFNWLGEMIFSFGAQAQIDKLTDSFPAYSREIDETYYDVAGLAEFDWKPTNWNETILGVRVGKHNAIDKVIATPRAAITFMPLSWLRTRTSFSMGYRAPQVFDEDLHITIVGGEGAIVKNAAGLKPEMSYGGAQQVELTFALSPEWSFKTGLNGFITYLTDSFALDNVDDPSTPGEIEFLRINSGETIVYGGEIETSLMYRDAFRLRAGWALEKGKNSEPDPDFDTKDVFRTPSAYGFAEVSAKLPYGFEPYTALEITGPMKAPHYEGYIDEDRGEETPWFFEWDIGLSYRLPIKQGPELKLSAIARNLLNSFQKDLDKGPDRDAGYVYGPPLPRSFWFELRGEI